MCWRADKGVRPYRACGLRHPRKSQHAGRPPQNAQGRRYLRRGRCLYQPAAPVPPRDSQRQRKEKQFHAITTPTRLVLPPRDGSWENRRRPKRARRRAKIGACTDTSTSVSAEGHCTAARHTLFSLDRARPISLLARPKGAPAAPRAVGRGGARERAQFSPQAETELSGLCDDDNGGRIPAGQAPLREQNPPRPPPGGPTVFRRVSASGPPGSSPPCGCGAVFPNSPRLLPGRQTNRPRPPPGGQGPCNGRFTSCRAAPSCASRGPEWPCASAGSWG